MSSNAGNLDLRTRDEHRITNEFVGFLVNTALVTNSSVFKHITRQSPTRVNRRLEGTNRHHLLVQKESKTETSTSSKLLLLLDLLLDSEYEGYVFLWRSERSEPPGSHRITTNNFVLIQCCRHEGHENLKSNSFTYVPHKEFSSPCCVVGSMSACVSANSVLCVYNIFMLCRL